MCSILLPSLERKGVQLGHMGRMKLPSPTSSEDIATCLQTSALQAYCVDNNKCLKQISSSVNQIDRKLPCSHAPQSVWFSDAVSIVFFSQESDEPSSPPVRESVCRIKKLDGRSDVPRGRLSLEEAEDFATLLGSQQFVRQSSITHNSHGSEDFISVECNGGSSVNFINTPDRCSDGVCKVGIDWCCRNESFESSSLSVTWESRKRYAHRSRAYARDDYDGLFQQFTAAANNSKVSNDDLPPDDELSSMHLDSDNDDELMTLWLMENTPCDCDIEETGSISSLVTDTSP